MRILQLELVSKARVQHRDAGLWETSPFSLAILRLLDLHLNVQTWIIAPVDQSEAGAIFTFHYTTKVINTVRGWVCRADQVIARIANRVELSRILPTTSLSFFLFVIE